MGASEFSTRATGTTAAEAFIAAVQQAQYDHGHSGYSGTIAEKHEFIEVPLPDGLTVDMVMEQAYDFDATAVAVKYHHVLRRISEIVDDKWGPAACIKVGPNTWEFFGLASL